MVGQERKKTEAEEKNVISKTTNIFFLGINCLQTEVKNQKQKQVKTLGFEKRNKTIKFM